MIEEGILMGNNTQRHTANLTGIVVDRIDSEIGKHTGVVVVGFFFIMLFFLYPLRHYYTKLNEISHWKAFSMGYIFYLIVCASNPYLISSTGFLCILLLFSVISNPRYKIIDQ